MRRWYMNKEREAAVNWLQLEAVSKAPGPDRYALACPDCSHISPSLHVGDDQGSHGACAVFSCVNEHERLHNDNITNADTVGIWMDFRVRNGIAREGLTHMEAFTAVKEAGLLPEYRSIISTHRNLRALPERPLLLGYQITESWMDAVGWRMDRDWGRVVGYHSQLAVAAGQVGNDPVKRVYICWTWGTRQVPSGIIALSEEIHKKRIMEAWMFVPKD